MQNKTGPVRVSLLSKCLVSNWRNQHEQTIVDIRRRCLREEMRRRDMHIGEVLTSSQFDGKQENETSRVPIST